MLLILERGIVVFQRAYDRTTSKNKEASTWVEVSQSEDDCITAGMVAQVVVRTQELKKQKV